MTAEGRFLIRTWRDRERRRERVQMGENIPLAEHLPPIHERGRDDAWNRMMAKRERRQRAERLEALAA